MLDILKYQPEADQKINTLLNEQNKDKYNIYRVTKYYVSTLAGVCVTRNAFNAYKIGYGRGGGPGGKMLMYCI